MRKGNDRRAEIGTPAQSGWHVGAARASSCDGAPDADYLSQASFLLGQAFLLPEHTHAFVLEVVQWRTGWGRPVEQPGVAKAERFPTTWAETKDALRIL